ncbi:MAG: molybdopterin dinucleotide binding domain-containing protein [Dehalococcoidia bacterium]|nr:molybdopterin dinucleotide binding domain-containing protein [Dehalococcoidia bacterium]
MAKTPAWAEAICGVRGEVIAGLAREYASSKPADLRGGWAPGRTAYGEQFHRACIALSAMTGNIGIPGGGPGCWVTQDFQRTLGVSLLPPLANPTGKSIVGWRWADAVLEGVSGGYPSDIRMIYSIGGNRLNQCGDIKKSVQALEKVEFVVVQDQFLTPIARHADIVLPVNTHFEREDIQIPHGQGNYLIFNHQVIPNLEESKSDLDILTALAQRIGGGAFGDKTAQEWLPELIKHAPAGYEDLRSQDVFRYGTPAPRAPLQEFVADPRGNPLPTPSGKVEIFSQGLAQRQQALLPPLPQYIAAAEASPPPTQRSYPFLLVTVHSRKSVHSSFQNVPWLQEIEPHTLCMNPVDATAQGIRDGQKVIVRSEIGAVVIATKLTERIMPGVVSIPQGAWRQLDKEGVDWNGSVNVLCPDTISPGEASVTNAVPVTVARWES